MIANPRRDFAGRYRNPGLRNSLGLSPGFDRIILGPITTIITTITTTTTTTTTITKFPRPFRWL